MATAFSENLTAEQQSQVLQLFQQFQHPTLQKDLIELKTLKKVEKGGDVLRIELQLPFAWNTGVEQVKQQLSDALLKATDSKEIKWVVNYQIATLKRANNQPAVKGVKNIIAVTSDKGGVGKSTITTLFASYLHANAKDKGLVIGVVDIDDFQNSIGSLRDRDKRDPDYSEEFDVIPLSSEEFINRIDFLRDAFDIILVDFPGSLKQ